MGRAKGKDGGLTTCTVTGVWKLKGADGAIMYSMHGGGIHSAR